MPPRSKKHPKRRRKAKRPPRPAPKSRIAISPRDRDAGKWFGKLVALQARLRAPNGCPWDREQTHETLRKFLIEETYEVLDAMESGDPRKFASELGDLLLQVVFHGILGEEAGRFTLAEVIESVHAKMVRRHPHVFGDAQAGTSAAVLKKWEEIKAEERAQEEAAARSGQLAAEGEFRHEEGKAGTSILAGVPRSLPAALEAYQLTRRAAHIGFDWENLAGILEKLEEETREVQSAVALQSAASAHGQESPAGAQPVVPASETLRLEEEVGDLLFVGVNVARFLGVDPEIALKKANRKFRRRFEWMESAAAREGRSLADLPRARMEELWNQAKAHE
ncbi:MAG: nucleoside triphosphate pyrophosphohydrolase [Acidobacteriia bacterium]|nr:nucleoside triphosphate pyrophosphohydrolase [Terriglobia bacterium]